MKKGDMVIIAVIAVAFVLSIALLFAFSNQGSQVVIKQNNQIIYEDSININKTVDTGTNLVVVKNGTVYVEDANCKNQVCVNTGKISKKGESIVCLPNKMIVEIK